jgi:hypothetical protein
MPKDFLTINPLAARALAERSSALAVTRATNKVALVVRMTAPGTMKQHIRVILSPAGGGLGIIVSEHPATTFVIYKTRAHWITPKKPGGMLKFQMNGEDVYRRKVWHPGNQHPNNFLLKALEGPRII